MSVCVRVCVCVDKEIQQRSADGLQRFQCYLRTIVAVLDLQHVANDGVGGQTLHKVFLLRLVRTCCVCIGGTGKQSRGQPRASTTSRGRNSPLPPISAKPASLPCDQFAQARWEASSGQDWQGVVCG